MSFIYVIDLETTGFDLEQGAEIIEMGGSCLETAQPDLLDSDGPRAWGYFSQLCKPIGPIPPETSAIHHITDWHVKDASSTAAVYQNMTDDMPDRVIFAAHNSKFEQAFLKPFETKTRHIDWICTYKLTLTLFPDAPSHKNAALFYYLGLFDADPEHWSRFMDENQLHRALPDAIITEQILDKCLTFVSVEEAIAISAKPVLLSRVPFGKYRGTSWSDMDAGFLSWVLDRDFGEDILHTARHHLTRLNMEPNDE